MTALEMIKNLTDFRISLAEIAKASELSVNTLYNLTLKGYETSKLTDKKIARAYDVFKDELTKKASRL